MQKKHNLANSSRLRLLYYKKKILLGCNGNAVNRFAIYMIIKEQ